eukprot:2803916-Rhodomonas_salina.1
MPSTLTPGSALRLPATLAGRLRSGRRGESGVWSGSVRKASGLAVLPRAMAPARTLTPAFSSRPAPS